MTEVQAPEKPLPPRIHARGREPDLQRGVAATDPDPLFRRVVDVVEADRADLVELCLELGNIPSPHGRERRVAEAVVAWLDRNGIGGCLQAITEDSANAFGVIPGEGDGPSLVCDAHLDTGPALAPDAPERLRRIHTAWVEHDLIYGYGVINCKAQVAAFLIAARALRKAGVRLRGDLTVAGVAFETGEPSVDDTQGIDYPGVGFGSKWLVDRGVTADYALVGETSDFGIVRAECGQLSLKLAFPGREVYTPRLERGGSLQDHPNALLRASHAVIAIEDWATRYEHRERFDFAGGTIVPKAQVRRVRGTGGGTDVYLDVYLVPGRNPQDIRREVQQRMREEGLDCRVSPYHWSRGYVARGAEPLVAALSEAHRFVFGRDPVDPPAEVVSMWRDLNVFNEVGIPSVCYGAARQSEPYSDERDRCMRIDDLLAATKVYALTALAVCGTAA